MCDVSCLQINILFICIFLVDVSCLQINKIVGNARPDRQTLLFSATFPHTVESLARKALKFAPV